MLHTRQLDLRPRFLSLWYLWCHPLQELKYYTLEDTAVLNGDGSKRSFLLRFPYIYRVIILEGLWRDGSGCCFYAWAWRKNYITVFHFRRSEQLFILTSAIFVLFSLLLYWGGDMVGFETLSLLFAHRRSHLLANPSCSILLFKYGWL